MLEYVNKQSKEFKSFQTHSHFSRTSKWSSTHTAPNWDKKLHDEVLDLFTGSFFIGIRADTPQTLFNLKVCGLIRNLRIWPRC